MAITKPADMNFSDKNIIMIISGTPGVGKTTLALSAPDVLLIDTDNGMCRVKAEHRKDASICATFQEVRADIEAAKASGKYKTIVIDTGGALIEYMKAYILSNAELYPGAGKKAGGMAIAGYGYIKQLFMDFSADLRKNFNVIYLFHEEKKRDDDVTTYEIVCEGSTKTLVYQPADLAAHMAIINGKRTLGFSPTESYFGKAAYGIKGVMTIPELADGDDNNFLTKLFAQVRENLSKETASLDGKTKAYEAAMTELKAEIEKVTDAPTATACFNFVKNYKHALTSKTEATALLNEKVKSLKLKFNTKTQEFYNAEG